MNWEVCKQLALTIGSRYFIIASLFFLIYYVLGRKYFFFKKIQRRFPGLSDYGREVAYSLVTISIFALVSAFMLKDPRIAPHTTFYPRIAQHGWVYFIGAFPLMFLVHDTYFYWLHRLMHHRKLFRVLHLVHHQSTNPSPWAAYSFHPLEAVLESGIIVVFLFTIPIHGLHLLIFFLIMIIYNVYGHLGYELYPKGFNRHFLGRWINTSVNHNLHHQYFKGNYGLYFTLWDRLMGTLRSDYDERFEEATSRIRNLVPPPDASLP